MRTEPLLVSGLLSLLAAPAWADPLPSSGAFPAEFDESLGVEADIMLQGIHATQHVSFTTPRAWELTDDPVLQLTFEHSAALMPERSHISVFVNGLAMGTIRLDAANAIGTTTSFRIPRRILEEEYNDIAIEVEQHYTNDCEDPFDPALWTRVSKDSMVILPYQRKDVAPDLLAWPLPFFDKFGYGEAELTLVGMSAPTAATTRAAGGLGLALGRIAAWRGVEYLTPVATSAEAKSNALIIGTPAEVPEIATLLGELSLSESQGLVAVVPNPADPSLAVFVVTGGGAEGVSRAAAALAGQDRYQILSGSRATVNDVVTAPPPPTRQDPLPSPRTPSFDLTALGMEGQTVRGYYPGIIRVPLRLDADTHVRPAGGSVKIDYAYSAQLDTRLSAMEIRLGGLSLRSVPLAKVEGDEQATVSVTVPGDIIRPDGVLDVVFHLFPRDFNACEHITDRQIWATVFPSSTIELPRDHLASMPDLGLLRHDGWPFRAEPGAGVIAVLPNNPTPAAFAAGMQYAAELGRTSIAEEPEFALDLATNVSFSGSTAHFVVLADETPNAIYESLAGEDRLTTEGGPARELKDSAKRLLLGAEVGTAYGTIEEILQPANEKRAVLVLRAATSDGLAQLVDFATDVGKTRLLDGNLAVISADGAVRTLDVATKKEWGALSLPTAAQIGVRRNWWVIGIGLVGAAFVLAALVRLWVRGQGDAR